MLLPKPIIEIKKMNKNKGKINPLMKDEDDNLESQISLSRKLNSSENSSSHQEHGEANEIFVHQLI